MSKHRSGEGDGGKPGEPPRALPKALLPFAIGTVAGLLSWAVRSPGGGIALLFIGFMLLRPFAMQLKVGYQGGREWAGAVWFVFNMWFVVWAGLQALAG